MSSKCNQLPYDGENSKSHVFSTLLPFIQTFVLPLILIFIIQIVNNKPL